ncbi:MAG: BatD family protein [Fibrobacterota bacterium]|nr:BatD family protein [Fibrobacterota bacterium]
MIKRFCALIGIAMLTVGLGAPSGKDTSLDISSQVDRSEITIGDRIQYEIKVVFPAEGHVELPSVLGNLGSFEIKDYQASDPKEAGNLRIQTWRFNLSTFTVGKYTIPPQQVAYRHGTDTSAVVHYTQPIEINVIRTSAETVKDIADIATLAQLESGPPWLAYGLAAVFLLAVALLLWRRFRRKPALVIIKPALPPFEEAMAKIAGVKDLGLIRQNRAREFCFILSEALRRYLSRRYGIDALEATTAEFLDRSRKLPVTAAQKQWLAEFSEGTDLIKFANALLLESDATAMLAKVEEFLRQTKPAELAASGQDAPRQPGQGSTSGPLKKPVPKTSSDAKVGGASGASSAQPGKSGTPAKPKGPYQGPGYTQGGHGHDDDNSKGWVG